MTKYSLAPRKKQSAMSTLTNIVFKGLLKHIPVSILFVLIFFCLFASCYYESNADELFSMFVSIKTRTIDTTVCNWYAFNYIMHLCFGWLHNYLFYANSVFMKSLICKFLLQKYLNLEFIDFNMIGTGQIHSIINKQAESTIFFLSNIVLSLFYSVFYIILFFNRLFKEADLPKSIMNVFLAVSVASTLLIVFCCYISFKMKGKLLREEHKNSHALLDILKNFTIVKAFNSEKFEVFKHEKRMNGQSMIGYSYYSFESSANLLFKACIFGGVVSAIFSKNSYSVFNNQDQMFFKFLTLLLNFKKHINTLKDAVFRINDKFVESVTCDLYPEVETAEKTNILGENATIQFIDTSITYENFPIFDQMNLQVNDGAKIAITGRNGMGKSTILKALLGMQEYKGKILINGIDIADISENSLRDYVSYVPQEPNLFDISVMDNLKYGKKLTDEEVYRKCEECGVHSIFKGLEFGYETIIGENCKNISGGQAQMINFMRAYIKDAPIFLLDEPTSCLDYSTSNRLMEMVFDHLKNKTVFLTTHNPNHLVKFDKIVNISSKKAVVYETCEEFLKNGNFEEKM